MLKFILLFSSIQNLMIKTVTYHGHTTGNTDKSTLSPTHALKIKTWYVYTFPSNYIHQNLYNKYAKLSKHDASLHNTRNQYSRIMPCRCKPLLTAVNTSGIKIL